MADPCGIPAVCGRPAGHRGHHGGWRSPAQITAPVPVDHAEPGLGAHLTFRSLQVVAEVAWHGSLKDAAACLGTSLQTVKGHVSTAHIRAGTSAVAQLLVLLGWASVPGEYLQPDHREEGAA